ncbi:MAG: ISAzo13 family transposase [Betaproteobacteria bacterium]|nr:ISAzo13 family transposase [Betaproteobacteria bacterium]
MATAIHQIELKYRALVPVLDERSRRHWAATEAAAYGWGGVSAVSRATGMSPNTIRRGLIELAARADDPDAGTDSRLRGPGGGRKRLTETDPELSAVLDGLVDPLTRGDPESSLRWTCKSTARLAAELTRQGHAISARAVAQLLKDAHYSLQGNRKTQEGSAHPDRNAQFEYISATVKRFQRRSQPVISVDAKKKEAVGPFKNGGREWQPKGEPEKVLVHDFVDKELGKVLPYGVFDLTQNEGWVSVGIDHDTAQFAVQAIGRWWQKMGSKRYPHAKELLITADGGGSNGSRCRLWKVALQELAVRLEMPISVCHFPPGTSKWNKIEHRMFSHITQNWRGRPLVSHEVIVNLIAKTTTRTGLKIRAELDRGTYPTGIKIDDAEMNALSLKLASFHGEWNYTLLPKRKRT